MNKHRAKSLSLLGFLTVLDAAPHGLFGGYLILNPAGRPLEFHCTAPVKANRAQQILYGPTLEPFLYAEQIGQTLVAKARQHPLVVLTDSPPVLELRHYVDRPVALVLDNDDEPDDQVGADPALSPDRPASQRPPRGWLRVDGRHARCPPLVTFRVAHQRLAVAPEQDNSLQDLTEDLTDIARRLDLTEPFDRIRAAIREARKLKGKGSTAARAERPRNGPVANL